MTVILEHCDEKVVVVELNEHPCRRENGTSSGGTEQRTERPRGYTGLEPELLLGTGEGMFKG